MEEIENAVKSYIKKAFSGLDPMSFSQEPAYIAALMGRLSGTAWEGENGASVVFKTTVVDDRGPRSAEGKYGADFAVTLESNSSNGPVLKAILGQGKKGEINKLSSSEQARLAEQCKKMSKRTSQYIVMETPRSSGSEPMIAISSKNKNALYSTKRITLSEYIVKHFIACKHGDHRPDFVSAVKHSNLNILDIIVAGLDYSLSPDNGPQSPRKHRSPKF